MTSEKLKALSGYASKAAAQIDTIFANLEDLIGSLGKIAGHVDALGDQVDKISISLAEAAKEMPATEPSLSLRDISPRGGDKGAGAKVDRPQSGVPGITWNEERQRWHVFRYEGGKKLYVGRYEKLEDAKAALKKAKATAAKVTKTAKVPAKAAKKPAKKVSK